MKGRGKAGWMGLTDKKLPLSKVLDSATRKILDTASKGVTDWSEFFDAVTLRATLGGNRNFEFAATQEGVARALGKAFTPKKRVNSDGTLGLDLKGEPASPMSEDAWEANLFGDHSFPELKPVLSSEVLNSPHSAAKKTASIVKAIGILELNLGNIGEYLSHQQGALKESLNEVVGKLNALTFANSTLDQRVGYLNGFGDEFEVRSAFEGLRFLDEELQSVIDRLGGEEGLKALEKAPYQMLLSLANRLESDVSAVDARLKSMPFEELKTAHANLKSSFQVTIGSLKTNFLLPLMKAHKTLMDPRSTILNRVETLEGRVRTISSDKDCLFGGFQVESFMNGTGVQVGGSLASGWMELKIVELEKASTNLRSEVDKLRALVMSIKDVKVSTDNDGSMERFNARLLVFEANDGDGVTVGIHNVQSVGLFLTTQVPEDVGDAFAWDWIGLVHYSTQDESAATVNSIMARDHHAQRGGFNQVGAAVMYALMQQSVPGPLAGATSATAASIFPLPGIKKFKLWDNQDGINGI
jgi:hypothetical protein